MCVSDEVDVCPDRSPDASPQPTHVARCNMQRARNRRHGGHGLNGQFGKGERRPLHRDTNSQNCCQPSHSEHRLSVDFFGVRIGFWAFFGELEMRTIRNEDNKK